MATSGPLFLRLGVPTGIEELLECLAREVLRHQPKDIYRFAATHFQGLLLQRQALANSATSIAPGGVSLSAPYKQSSEEKSSDDEATAENSDDTEPSSSEFNEATPGDTKVILSDISASRALIDAKIAESVEKDASPIFNQAFKEAMKTENLAFYKDVEPNEEVVESKVASLDSTLDETSNEQPLTSRSPQSPREEVDESESQSKTHEGFETEGEFVDSENALEEQVTNEVSLENDAMLDSGDQVKINSVEKCDDDAETEKENLEVNVENDEINQESEDREKTGAEKDQGVNVNEEVEENQSGKEIEETEKINVGNVNEETEKNQGAIVNEEAEENHDENVNGETEENTDASVNEETEDNQDVDEETKESQDSGEVDVTGDENIEAFDEIDDTVVEASTEEPAETTRLSVVEPGVTSDTICEQPVTEEDTKVDEAEDNEDQQPEDQSSSDAEQSNEPKIDNQEGNDDAAEEETKNLNEEIGEKEKGGENENKSDEIASKQEPALVDEEGNKTGIEENTEGVENCEPAESIEENTGVENCKPTANTEENSTDVENCKPAAGTEEISEGVEMRILPSENELIIETEAETNERVNDEDFEPRCQLEEKIEENVDTVKTLEAELSTEEQASDINDVSMEEKTEHPDSKNGVVETTANEISQSEITDAKARTSCVEQEQFKDSFVRCECSEVDDTQTQSSEHHDTVPEILEKESAENDEGKQETVAEPESVKESTAVEICDENGEEQDSSQTATDMNKDDSEPTENKNEIDDTVSATNDVVTEEEKKIENSEELSVNNETKSEKVEESFEETVNKPNNDIKDERVKMSESIDVPNAGSRSHSRLLKLDEVSEIEASKAVEVAVGQLSLETEQADAQEKDNVLSNNTNVGNIDKPLEESKLGSIINQSDTQDDDADIFVCDLNEDNEEDPKDENVTEPTNNDDQKIANTLIAACVSPAVTPGAVQNVESEKEVEDNKIQDSEEISDKISKSRDIEPEIIPSTSTQGGSEVTQSDIEGQLLNTETSSLLPTQRMEISKIEREPRELVAPSEQVDESENERSSSPPQSSDEEVLLIKTEAALANEAAVDSDEPASTLQELIQTSTLIAATPLAYVESPPAEETETKTTENDDIDPEEGRGDLAPRLIDVASTDEAPAVENALVTVASSPSPVTNEASVENESEEVGTDNRESSTSEPTSVPIDLTDNPDLPSTDNDKEMSTENEGRSPTSQSQVPHVIVEALKMYEPSSDIEETSHEKTTEETEHENLSKAEKSSELDNISTFTGIHSGEFHDSLPLTPLEVGSTLPDLSDPELEEAATKIQASYRGFRARANRQKSKDHAEPPHAISVPETRRVLDENESAIKIQAGVRGYLTRQQLKKDRDLKPE